MSEWYTCQQCGTERENLCACLNSKCEDFNGDVEFAAAIEATNSPTAKRIAELERKLADMRAELSEAKDLIAEIQSKCVHLWEKCDASFSHEFGTEIIRYMRCEICGKTRDADDGPFPEADDEPRIDQRELRDFP